MLAVCKRQLDSDETKPISLDGTGPIKKIIGSCDDQSQVEFRRDLLDRIDTLTRKKQKLEDGLEIIKQHILIQSRSYVLSLLSRLMV